MFAAEGRMKIRNGRNINVGTCLDVGWRQLHLSEGTTLHLLYQKFISTINSQGVLLHRKALFHNAIVGKVDNLIYTIF